MPTVPLPKRTGPKHGNNAFTPRGEALIYDAYKAGAYSKIQIAAKCGCSLVTVDAILKRESSRRQQEGAGPEGHGA